MKFESDREKQTFCQIMHKMRDVVRYLDDTGASGNAELGRDIHTTLNKLRQGYYIDLGVLTSEEMLS